MGVERSEHLFLYESYLAATANILGILYGLNRLYHPGKLKGVAWVIERMTIKPPRLRERLENLFRLEPEAAVTALYTLIDEVLSLVETHLPGLSTAGARNRPGMKLRQ